MGKFVEDVRYPTGVQFGWLKFVVYCAPYRKPGIASHVRFTVELDFVMESRIGAGIAVTDTLSRPKKDVSF
jgi:hypothetical protein